MHGAVFDDGIGGRIANEHGGVFVVFAEVDGEVVFGFYGVAVDAAV